MTTIVTVGADDPGLGGPVPREGAWVRFRLSRVRENGDRYLSADEWRVLLDDTGAGQSEVPDSVDGVGLWIDSSIQGWQAVVVAGYPATTQSLVSLVRGHQVDPSTLLPLPAGSTALDLIAGVQATANAATAAAADAASDASDAKTTATDVAVVVNDGRLSEDALSTTFVAPAALTSAVAPKANTSDVYSKTVADARFALATGAPATQLLMHGDSLMANFGSNNALIKTAFGSTNVTDTGVGGMSSTGIAALQGGRPANITVTGGVIPASGSVTVTTDVSILFISATSGTKSQDGILAGVAGTLSMVKTSGTYVYTFTRTTAGYAVAVPGAAPFITGQAWRNNVMLLDGGRNNLTDDPALIVSQYRDMIAWNKADPNSHIILNVLAAHGENVGVTARTQRDALNAALKAAFPRNYVDWAGFLASTTALTLAGLTAAGTDADDIANGITPQSLRNTGDDLHINSAAYTIVQPLILREFAARGVVTYSDPIPVPTVHGYGLTDATHRYITEGLTGSTGDAFKAWADSIGTLNLANASGTLKLGTGPGSVDFSVDTPNAAVAANSQRVYNTTGDSTIRTIAVVYNNRTPAAVAHDLVAASNPGFRIGRGANGIIAVSPVTGAGSGTPAQAVGSNVAGWKVAFGWYDPSTGACGVDVSGTAYTSTLTLASVSNTFVAGGVEAVATDLGTAEVLTWNRILSSDDRTAVRAALKTHYPSIDT